MNTADKTALEQAIFEKARRSDHRLAVLKKAIQPAIDNSSVVQLAKQGVGFDMVAYQDALFYLDDSLQEDTLKGVMPLTLSDYQGVTAIYDDWQNEHLHLSFGDQICVHHSRVVLSLSLSADDFAGIKRVLGFHQISNNKALWQDADLTLFLPFDYLVFLDKKHVAAFGGKINPAWLFCLEPENDVFHHHITPSPVAGVMVDGQEFMHGFVVHPNILADYLDTHPEWKDERFMGVGVQEYRDALAFDSTLALKMLKYQYSLPILETQIQASEDIDGRLYATMKQYGHVVLEY